MAPPLFIGRDEIDEPSPARAAAEELNPKSGTLPDTGVRPGWTATRLRPRARISWISIWSGVELRGLVTPEGLKTAWRRRRMKRGRRLPGLRWTVLAWR